MTSGRPDSSNHGSTKPSSQKKMAKPESRDANIFREECQECYSKYRSLDWEERSVKDTADTLQERIVEIEELLVKLHPHGEELSERKRKFLSFADERLDSASLSAVEQIIRGITAPRLLEVLREPRKDAEDEQGKLGPELRDIKAEMDTKKTVDEVTNVIKKIDKTRKDHDDRKYKRVLKLDKAIASAKAVG